jgi:hypothetical protein
LPNQFTVAIADLAGGKDQKAVLARTFADDIRRHYETILAPMFAVTDRVGETLVQADREAMAKVTAELRARMDARKQALQALRRETDPGAVGKVDAAADLALFLVTLLSPPLDRMLEEHDAARAALAAAAAK